MNSEKVLKLPKIFDPDDDIFTISVFFDGSATMPVDFVSYDPATLTFKFTPKEESKLGKHLTSLKL